MASVVLCGYGDHAAAGLELLAELKLPIGALVVPWNRGGADVDRVTAVAAAHGIDVLVQPRRDEMAPFLAQLDRLAPAVILVWSYSLLLPGTMLAVPGRGAVNVHGGLLPEYRGGHVKQWAIINGERESGVTLHYMDEGIDTGSVIAQARFALDPDEDFATLGRKLRDAGRSLLRRWLPAVLAGTAPRVAQDERRAKYWPMRTPDQGRIEWSMRAEAICRLSRALACNDPGAFVDIAGRRLSVRRALPLPALVDGRRPGTTVANEDGVRIATADGDVLIGEVEYDRTVYRGVQLAELFRP